MFRDSRQRLWEGMTLFRLAEVDLTARRPAQAAANAELALTVLRGIGGDWRRGNVLTVLGRALSAIGQTGRAQVCWREALDIFEALERSGGRRGTHTPQAARRRLKPRACERSSFVYRRPALSAVSIRRVGGQTGRRSAPPLRCTGPAVPVRRPSGELPGGPLRLRNKNCTGEPVMTDDQQHRQRPRHRRAAVSTDNVHATTEPLTGKNLITKDDDTTGDASTDNVHATDEPVYRPTPHGDRPRRRGGGAAAADVCPAPGSGQSVARTVRSTRTIAPPCHYRHLMFERLHFP